MEVVIVFMKLPPLLPWWRKRKFPTSFFPSREEYRALVKESATAGKIEANTPPTSTAGKNADEGSRSLKRGILSGRCRRRTWRSCGD